MIAMSEKAVHPRAEQRIIIKLLTNGMVKPFEICQSLKVQFEEEILSEISIYK